MTKVIVGMSGGVDSSVTAYLLRQQGYEVEGVSFILWEARSRSSLTACCSLEAMTGAAETAGRIGVRHDAIDVRDEFIEKVIEPFAEAYMKGLTPNPCILCNKYIKFPFLLREAERRGAEYIATGHYARTVHDAGLIAGGPPAASPSARLLKGLDHKKDQSYVLYVLTPGQLGKLLLPLGEYRKVQVREIARDLKLPAADRPESQEICFIEDRNYARFIENLSPDAGEPGPILDMRGNVIGTHRGVHRYTIGQRKGLGISSPEPHYVVRIDKQSNAVYVGSQDDAKIRELSVSGMNWLAGPSAGVFMASVKIRSMMEAKPATAEVTRGGVKILFDEPQWAPAPGQSAVFYDGEIVLGGGTIIA